MQTLVSVQSSCESHLSIFSGYLTSRRFAHNSGWDIHDTPYFKELSISNRANGYQDIVARIDLSTYRRLPWENNVPFFLISFAHPEDGKPLIACARSILDGVVKRFEEGEQSLQCLAGAEFEVSLKGSIALSTLLRAHDSLCR